MTLSYLLNSLLSVDRPARAGSRPCDMSIHRSNGCERECRGGITWRGCCQQGVCRGAVSESCGRQPSWWQVHHSTSESGYYTTGTDRCSLEKGGSGQVWSILVMLWNISCRRVNTLRPRQNVCHFAYDTLKCIFLNENVWIYIKISLKFVPAGPVNNIPALGQIMISRQPGDKSVLTNDG